MYNNDRYNPGRNYFVCGMWYVVNALFFICPLIPFSCIKVALLRLFGSTVGKGVVIKPAVNIKYPWRLSIGDNVWIGERVWIDNLGQVTIGSNCVISQGAMLLTGNHDYTKQSFDLIVKDIVLQDGCWVCANSTVCPGVTVGAEAVLSVQSVATNDLEADYIYQGNPAQKIRMRVK